MIVDFDDLHEHNHLLHRFHELHDLNPQFRVTVFAVPALGTDAFWDSLPEWMEVAMHGWLHPHPREAEAWSYGQALEVMGRKPERFVCGWKSPGWQISEGTYEAVQELGWWLADHPENTLRRPDGIRTHVLGTGDHWHGHIQDVCGNGIEETWDDLKAAVASADSFELISEVVAPWRSMVAA